MRIALAAALLLAACAGQAPQIDAVQAAYAAGRSYVVLAGAASTWEASPAADQGSIDDLRAADRSAYAALTAEIGAISACPAEATANAACLRSAAVVGAAAGASQALADMSAALTRHGVPR